MSTLITMPTGKLTLPDHTQLPDRDGVPVRNDQEHPQSMLLTDSILPVAHRLHPDNMFCIGQDMGIYWRLAEPPETLQSGAICPDWYFIPGVPRMLGGQLRRSYVLWQEWVAPLLALEFVSGDGSEERDRTPRKGKYWVYEQAIRIPFYGIYEVDPGRIQMNVLDGGTYRLQEPNSRGHFEIPPLEVEVGIWRGKYQGIELPWMRWWNLQGELLLTGEERAEQERQRADRLAAQLRALGAEPKA